ncbi:MAG: hypothetical protein MUF05_06630 [Candidatus Omnitrophica bacterium]|jgi:Flp pilus assembly pilin Flp|nr:hypothetical protein [Candidatus Omnitrophota bacterium]
MFMRDSEKAQSTLEYAVIIAVVVAALIAMQTYFKRGVQGKIREASDQIGEQFSPGQTTNEYTIISNTESSEDVSGTTEDAAAGDDVGAKTKTTTVSKQKQTRTGTETVAKQSDEYWPQ